MLSLLNILCLRGFVSTCKKQDELLTVLDEIDSVAWAELNPKFGDSFPDWAYIPRIAKR
jgi:hypothetical protein